MTDPKFVAAIAAHASLDQLPITNLVEFEESKLFGALAHDVSGLRAVGAAHRKAEARLQPTRH